MSGAYSPEYYAEYYRTHRAAIAEKGKRYRRVKGEEVRRKNAEWRTANKELVKKLNASYYSAHLEELRRYAREYAVNHREEKYAYSAEWRAEHRDRINRTHREWYERNAERERTRGSAYIRRCKEEVVRHYGGKCACPGCEVSEIEFLTIDHIDGGGRRHRTQAGVGSSIYRWLKKNDFPQGFQVLCMNCNFAKGAGKRCPVHQEKKS